MGYLVFKCVCRNTTFADWLRTKRVHGWTLEEAARETQCGEGCGMCRPYLRVVESTGMTELPPLVPESLAP